MQKFFVSQLTYWNKHVNKRIMPWKGQKDAYKIWLSEIILQQTRVQQGLSYYNKFIEFYPQITDLAAASDDEVFKHWEGLGYYSRCRNLLHTARLISKEYKGIFPKTYNDILALKGIGPYTAAAIASFAYGLPYAVVDGNVYRVLSRFFGINDAIDSLKGKKSFSELANKCLQKTDPAAYNQAIMDFGAVVCKPQIPLCDDCILNKKCVAYKSGMVNQLPVKEKRLKITNRWFYYFLFRFEDKILVHQRKANDIWAQLFEFYLFEGSEEMHWNEKKIAIWLSDQLGIDEYFLDGISPVFKQKLTHQKISGQFIELRLKSLPKSLTHLTIIKETDIASLAFPRFINQFLEAQTMSNIR